MASILITGASRGIGLELCRQFRDRGDDVIAVCRDPSPALEELGAEIIEHIDVARDDDVEQLRYALKGRKIDVLINNAGMLRGDDIDTVDYDDMIEQFRVNTLGPLRVTRALLDNLEQGSKVGIVSSRVGSVGDNGSGNNYGYRVSKAAVNMVGKNLSHDLKPRGIAVALLHPGLVATDMTGGRGIPPEKAAAGLIQRMDELNLDTTGHFWHAEGEELPW
jgi:NAD(P)-dependent dehydrogenase (short-subunit alcohol dehydrogenase family)